jgi:hypothetical protein
LVCSLKPGSIVVREGLSQINPYPLLVTRNGMHQRWPASRGVVIPALDGVAAMVEIAFLILPEAVVVLVRW